MKLNSVQTRGYGELPGRAQSIPSKQQQQNAPSPSASSLFKKYGYAPTGAHLLIETEPHSLVRPPTLYLEVMLLWILKHVEFPLPSSPLQLHAQSAPSGKFEHCVIASSLWKVWVCPFRDSSFDWGCNPLPHHPSLWFCKTSIQDWLYIRRHWHICVSILVMWQSWQTYT